MADPLTIIGRICDEQPHDALSQIADALGYTEQVAQERAQREQTLAGLVKRLAQRLHPEDPLRVTATTYLQKQGLFNPLRNGGVPAGAPAEPLHDSAWVHACPKSTGNVKLPIWRACTNCGAAPGASPSAHEVQPAPAALGDGGEP